MNRCPYRLIPGAACVAASEPGHGAREVQRRVIVGVGELAQELGVHRQSIWAVMNGSRTSHRLHEALKARGFQPASIQGRRRRGDRKPQASAS